MRGSARLAAGGSTESLPSAFGSTKWKRTFRLLGVDAQGFGSATDEATLLGALDPTGTVTYSVYDNDNCLGFPEGTSTVVVAGPHVPLSDVFRFLPPGTHQVVATYSGDAINDPVTSRCGDARLVWSH